MIRTVAHIHTFYSYDCLMNPAHLLHHLEARGLDLALIVDHDSFAGSIHARQYADRTHARVRIPVAAEILTEHGDVIVAFDTDPNEPVNAFKKWNDLQRIVRQHSGLIWLPHPYQSHSHVEELAAGADVVEVFNARCTAAQNELAADLCQRLGKTPGYGSDAHLYSECESAIAEYPDAISPILCLRQTPICRVCKPTLASQISLTQIIKGVKLRKGGLVIHAMAGYVKRRVFEARHVRK